MTMGRENEGRASKAAVRSRGRRVTLFRVALLIAGAWLAGFVVAASLDAQVRSELVVDVEWLQDRLGDPGLVVLQIGRAEAPEGPWIPGAVALNLNDLALNSEEGEEPRIALDLPEDLSGVRALFEAAGVSDDSRVVVVFEGSGVPSATRTIWTLEVLGMGARTSLLNGGFEAWKAADAELADAPGDPEPGRITAEPRPDRRATAAWVLDRGEANGVALIDARRPESYDGTRPEMEGRAGHIPGAGSLPYPELYTEDGLLRSEAELIALFEAAGFQAGDQLVAYCHIGYWASAVVFAARSLGFDARLYDGSMTEWAQDPDLPLVVPAGR